MDPAIPRLASAGPARLIVGPFRAHKARGDLSALRNLQVTGTNGTSILLSAVAELNLGSGPATIQRAGSDAEGHGRGRAQRRSARRSAERLRASLLVVGVARRPAHEPERTRPRPAEAERGRFYVRGALNATSPAWETERKDVRPFAAGCGSKSCVYRFRRGDVSVIGRVLDDDLRRTRACF
jgi:hypothetical protein